MEKLQKQVLEFHQAFDCVINDKPTMPDIETRKLRAELIIEEFTELCHAMKVWGGRMGDGHSPSNWFEDYDGEPDLVEIADALGDLLYVIYGTAVSCGIDLEPITDEIHRSNMSKVCADGTVLRREDGKIIKPETYSPADIKTLIQRQTDWWRFRRCAVLKSEIEAMAEGGEELSGTDTHREFDSLMAALPKAAQDAINEM